MDQKNHIFSLTLHNYWLEFFPFYRTSTQFIISSIQTISRIIIHMKNFEKNNLNIYNNISTYLFCTAEETKYELSKFINTISLFTKSTVKIGQFIYINITLPIHKKIYHQSIKHNSIIRNYKTVSLSVQGRVSRWKPTSR